MEKLLSDTWNNAALNHSLHEALIYFKREEKTATLEEKNESYYFRHTAFYLVDHPRLDINIVFVKDDNRELVFISKDFLVDQLNMYKFNDIHDISKKVIHILKDLYKKMLIKENIVELSGKQFSEILKEANLENISKNFKLTNN